MLVLAVRGYSVRLVCVTSRQGLLVLAELCVLAVIVQSFVVCEPGGGGPCGFL